MTNNTLCLHTAQFPYGLSEQFIETEITYLAQAFERVVIIPGAAEGTPRPLPDNVEVCVTDYSCYTTAKGLQQVGSWMRYCLSDVHRSTNKKITLSTLLRAGYQAEVLFYLLKNKNLIDNTLHYTYWFNEQSTLLSILKSKKRINGFISRAHGFDLYEDRNKEGFIPFRKFQLKNVSKLFLISKDGLEYIKSKYPKYQHKYQLSYLGIENNHPLNLSIPDSKEYLLVSCSRVVDIKRVYLIVEALSKITDFQIRWVHFGDGPLINEVKELAKEILPDNIKTEFKGMIPNQAVLQYFQNNFVDCFINTSSSEGLSVSIMEATGYGIPVLATNVGGTNEIVNNSTGILLSEHPEPIEIAQNLQEVFMSFSRNAGFRQKVYNYWNNHFNAEINYQRFTNTLKNL
ncbi:glycosyltransferase [Marinilabilia salmonicolor]|uniref:Glycosyltransferase involved in cell wall biosynthesis n=1 Tax=Marinilabilia salmonicolor TaxID=989 RepID=A0A368UJC1_9BACT|nr:glycosyltransferase [Marinilabilia salmonicolor]RCW27030.1 glycosyltransferase involved in cell wall biosynthesis [Marinilabilia salmonicolor]